MGVKVVSVAKRSGVFLFCVCVVFLWATPSLAAINPFMDVPLNHWSYDAIGQLAARGVLSGYPDGTYKGRQPTTRYEMASALARALALVDLTKAEKRDIETLKRLVVEFKDELDALGVRMDQLDKRISVVEDRLGGWQITGELRLDIDSWDSDLANGTSSLSMGRLEFQRWFGEDEGLFLFARVDATDDGITYDKFYVDVPFFWDSTVTVGRFDRDFEGDYRFQTGGATDIANEAWLTDRTVDGLGFSKSFALGSVNAYVARPDDLPSWNMDESLSLWELAALAQLQFTERFGFDLGVQALFGDGSSIVRLDDNTEYAANHLWTIFGGLRFDFSPNIALRGIYYYQDKDAEQSIDGADWMDLDLDSASAWKVIVDIKQDLLQFTSLWLEYGYLDGDFFLTYNNTALTLADEGAWNTVDGGAAFMGYDTKIWRVGALQEWNEKWHTWLYVAGHTLDNVGPAAAPRDAKMTQWGLGVEYLYNENVTFALGYLNVDWNDDAETVGGYTDDHIIRFRTAVTF
ncbi:MAG: S-layer homology domain-containing protein [Synergistaceae bacterium]|nr:S-layer homology domain-containing protein [Synergistaceae bacterium]